MAYVVTGFVHFYAGRFDEAIAELEAGAAVVEDTGNLNFVLYRRIGAGPHRDPPR